MKKEKKISEILMKAAVMVKRNGTKDNYLRGFACNAINTVQGKRLSETSEARSYFENLFDVKKIESQLRQEGRGGNGIFGDMQHKPNQSDRVQALLLAAEVAKSEGL